MKSFEVPLVVVSAPETNITDLFLDRVKLDPNLAIISKQDEPGVWQDVTASDYLNEVKALEGVLHSYTLCCIICNILINKRHGIGLNNYN